jgi:hypothetical protein
MQSPAFEASIPPIATTRDRAQPVEPDRRIGILLRGRRPDRPDPEVVRVGCERLLERRRRPAEKELGSAGRFRPLVLLPEVHAVRGEGDRGLDVVVHDEGHAELAEAGSGRDRLLRRRALHPQLDDGGSGRNGCARRLEVGDDRVQPHVIRARSSSVSASRAASAS